MTKIIFRLLLTLSLSGLVAAGLAGTNIDKQTHTPRVTPPCPALMTELECGRHQASVAQLAPGPALERYLAEFEATMRDREAACSCNRKLPPESYYPSHKQALLHQ